MTDGSSPNPRLLGWWPVVVILGVAVVAVRVLGGRYDAVGHAAGHLGSGLMVFLMVAFLAIVLWAAPEARGSWAVRLASLAYLLGLLVILVGNLRVVDAIGGEDWSDGEAFSLGESIPGFESGHSLSGQGALLAVAAAVALTWALHSRRVIPTGLAIGATVACIFFPYWILPGGGLVVSAVGVVVLRARKVRLRAEPVPVAFAEVR